MTVRTKPTILVVISHYLPGQRAGGPVRTISNMVEWLGGQFHFMILTADRDIGDIEAYSNIQYGSWQPVGKAQVRYLAPEERSLNGLRKLFHTFTYDLIYLDAALATFTLKTLLLKRLGLLPSKPVVLVPRGQWRPEALHIKSFKKRTFLVGARLIGLYGNLFWHASSPEEREDIEREVKDVTRNIRVIPNLPLRPTSKEIRQPRLKQSGQARLVFLSRLVRNKGLHFLLERLLSVKGTIDLDIYGPIEDLNYWQSCQELIDELPSSITVKYQGVVKFDEVIYTLSQYHLFVLPTLSENFGQVILEALASGCPILISDRTPWQNLADAGWILSLENILGWKNNLQKIVDLNQVDFDRMAKGALDYGNKYINDPKLMDELRDYFMELCCF